MFKRLIACWLSLALLCGFTAPEPHPVIFPVVSAMAPMGAKYQVEPLDCGHINAYYLIQEQKIILCNELAKELGDGVARCALAHEIGHAVIRQLDIPFTGSEEVAADELAAYALITAGHVEDILACSKFWLVSGAPEDPLDDHPGDLRRGFTLGCLATGSKVPSGVCKAEWERVKRTWERLLLSSKRKD